MDDDAVVVVFFDIADHECYGCEGVFAASEDPDEKPVLFNIECEEHDSTHAIVFHRRCMPEELKATYEATQAEMQKRNSAQWN